MYRVKITITLRPSILDPQGKAAGNALANLGFDSVDRVRVGKIVEMWIKEDSPDVARSVAAAACEKLLANPVMEDFAVQIVADPVSPGESGS